MFHQTKLSLIHSRPYGYNRWKHISFPDQNGLSFFLIFFFFMISSAAEDDWNLFIKNQRILPPQIIRTIIQTAMHSEEWNFPNEWLQP